MASIFTYITHKKGVADDTALELISAAKVIDSDCKPTAIILGSPADVAQVAAEMAKSYTEVITVGNDALNYPNAEVYRKVLAALLPANALLLVPHDTFGMDLSPGLSIKRDASYAADVIGFEGMDGGKLKVIRQEYGGTVSTRSLCDLANGAVINIRAGVFKADESQAQQGAIVDKSSEIQDFSSKRTFVEVIEAEVGDVDITKSEILVSVGRGIGEEENLEMVHTLAKAMGGEVACSRPIVDAKWLEKSRQVGTSGQTVKPKAYLALGISGSFQHMGGIKGNPFIIAVNKNPNAPIFQMADVGVVADILEFIPALTEKVNQAQ
jgi:electron transfer flavoprotein alpha subunit